MLRYNKTSLKKPNQRRYDDVVVVVVVAVELS